MEITIIGGGITGLATASALRKLGMACTVYERAAELNEVGAGIWMQPNALKALDWLGLGDQIRQKGMLLNSVDITDHQLIPFRQTEAQDAFADHKIVSIHRARLQKILFDALPEGMVRLGQDYVSHDEREGRVGIRFREMSEEVETDLLLGADGIHSKVRRQLFPSSQTRYSGQTCWRGIADFELAEAWLGKGREAWGKGLRFGFANVSPNEVYWFAVSKAPENGRDTEGQRQKMLLDKFWAFHKVVKDIIAHTPEDKILRNDISDLRRLDAWYSGRSCLIGDAAHATTPNMGQGAGQGIEDAYYLANILKRADTYGQAFQAFDRERRKKVDYVVRNSWRFGKMAHSGLGRELMKLVMKWTPQRMLEKQLESLYSIKTF